jgi:hypothetical protein
MQEKTEAQRLADWLDGHDGALWVTEAAAELRRLDAEVQALRGAVPAGWQPIETAPKDGTAILVSEGCFCYCVEWNDEFDWWAVDDNKLGPFRLRGAAPTLWTNTPPLAAAPQPTAQTNKKFTEAEVKAAFMAGFDAPETMHPTAVINDAEECWSAFWEETTPSTQGEKQ